MKSRLVEEGVNDGVIFKCQDWLESTRQYRDYRGGTERDFERMPRENQGDRIIQVKGDSNDDDWNLLILFKIILYISYQLFILVYRSL